MNNLTIYCLCLHDELLEKVKKINYQPVALGENNFQKGWIRDNQDINISKKNMPNNNYTYLSAKALKKVYNELRLQKSDNECASRNEEW